MIKIQQGAAKTSSKKENSCYNLQAYSRYLKRKGNMPEQILINLKKDIEKYINAAPLRGIDQDLRYIAFINMLDKRCGGVPSSSKQYVDNPAYQAFPYTERLSVINNVPQLTEWARNEAISHDINHLINVCNLNPNERGIARAEHNKRLHEIEQIRVAVSNVYNVFLNDESDDRKQNVLINFYGLPVFNSMDISRKFDWDIFGSEPNARRRGVESPVKRLPSKLQSNLFAQINKAYFEEICLLKDIKPVAASGNEVFYRGIPAQNDGFIDNAFTERHVHLPEQAKLNFALKTKWWPFRRNTFGASLTTHSPTAIEYALFKARGNKNKNSSGYVYVIKPPAGAEMASFAHYGSDGSNTRELTAPHVPSSWIEKRVRIKKLSGRRYVVESVEENPYFHKILSSSRDAGEDAKLKPYVTKKSRLRNGLFSIAGRRGYSALHDSDKTVKDIFRQGVIIKDETSLYNRLRNKYWLQFQSHWLGVGGKTHHSYKVTIKDQSYSYNTTEQDKLYNALYRKSPETSKSRPKYKDEAEFHANYQKKQMRERRAENMEKFPSEQQRFSDSFGIDNMLKVHFSYAEGFNYGAYEKARTGIKSITLEYMKAREKKAGVLDTEDRFRDDMAGLLYSNDSVLLPHFYDNLNGGQKIIVNNFLHSIEGESKKLINQIRENNRNVDLCKGLYGGVGIRGDVVARGGFRVDEVFKGCAAESAGITNGQYITHVKNFAGRWVDLTQDGMNNKNAVDLIRGGVDGRLEIKIADREITLQRNVVNAKYHEVYDPKVNYERSADVNARVNNHDFFAVENQDALDNLRQENLRRAHGALKYDDNGLENRDIENIKSFRANLKHQRGNISPQLFT